MNPVIDWLNHVSVGWSTQVFHATWQSAAVSGVLLAVVGLGRRWPAPLRYCFLVLALVKFACPPLLPVPTGLFSQAGPTVTSPSAIREIARHSTPESTQMSSIPAVSQPANAISSETGVAADLPAGLPGVLQPRSATIDASAESHSFRWTTWLLMLHLAGSFAVAFWIGRQIAFLRRAARRSRVITDGPFFAQFKELSQQLELRRIPRLLISSEVNSPIAFGVLRPTVVLPSTAVDKLPVEQIRTILAHELAHYRRGDLWVNWLQLLLLVMWWFNPVLWLLNRAIRKVREDCCDDLLLARELTSNEAYCEVLLGAATELSGKIPVGATLGFAEQLHPLGRRLARIMDKTLKRSARLSRVGLLVFIVLAGVLLPGVRSQSDGATNEGRSNKSSRDTTASETKLNVTEARKKVAELLQALKKTGLGQKENWAVMNELLKLGPESAPVIAETLRKADNEPDTEEKIEIRRKAAEVLSEMGPAATAAIPYLIHALEDDDPVVVNYCATALGEMGPLAKEAVPALIEAMRFGNGNAARALAQIDPQSEIALKALIDFFQDKSISDHAANCSKSTIASAIGEMGPYARTAVPALAAALTDDDRAVHEAVAEALKQIATPEAARALTQVLDHTNGLVRLRAAEGLLKQDSKNKEALAVLGGCMKDANADVRIAAVYAINNLSTNLGSATAALVPGLLNALNGEKTWTRTGAILALTKFGSRENQIISALTEKSHDEDGYVRLYAAQALAKLAGQTNPAVSVLTELLTNSDGSARGQAAIALADLAPAYRPALSALKELLRDPNPYARYGAAKALWALNHDAGEVVPTLIGIVEDNIHMRWAIDLLGEVGPPAKAALPVLKKAVWSKRSGAYARAALAKIDPNSASTISTSPAGVGTRPVKRVEKPISIPAVPVALAPQIKTLNTP